MITVSPELLAQMQSHAEQGYPEEACGVLLGVERDGQRTVHAVLPLENRQDENRRRRFLVTPEQYRRAERDAEERRMQLLGFYHSHPDHPARPSAFDTEHAFPWFSYVIIAVEKGKARDSTAWLLREDRTAFGEDRLTVQAAPEHHRAGDLRSTG